MNSIVRKWGEQILRKKEYAASLALIFAFLSFFDVPTGWLSSVIIAMVTLQNGPRQGLMIIAWTILPAVAMLCLGHYALAINLILLRYLIVYLFAVMLYRYTSWIVILQLGVFLGVVAVTVIHFFIPELQAWLLSQLLAVVKEYKTISLFAVKAREIDNWVSYFNLFSVGLFVLSILLTNLTHVFLARWWQSNVVQVVNLQKECYQIRISYIATILLVLLVAGFYINGPLFFNIAVIAMMPFVFCGLSLLHCFCAVKRNGHLLLLVFYGLFILLSPYMVMVTTTLGWLDSFLNFRKKFIVEKVIEE